MLEYVTVPVPANLWWRVDTCVDNSMAIDVVDLLMLTVINGACVRDAGWRAAAAFPGERDEHGWPPPESELQVVLRREHWDWVVDQLDRWQEYAVDSGIAQARAVIVHGLG